jgi:hypothetical protein
MLISSPELALVDPELAATARPLIADPPDCLTPRLRQRPPIAAISQPDTEPGRRARPVIVAAVAWLLVALVVGSPSFDLTRRISAGSSVTPAGIGAGPAVEANHRALGPAATSAHTVRRTILHWPEVAGTVFYAVVLWRDGVRVKVLRSPTNHLSIRLDGRLGDMRLAPGRYLWSVFASVVQAGATHFGRSLTHGELQITRPSP